MGLLFKTFTQIGHILLIGLISIKMNKNFSTFSTRCHWHLLCILTSKQVLPMPFTGQNQISNSKTTFCILFSNKMYKITQKINISYTLPLTSAPNRLDYSGLSTSHTRIAWAYLEDANKTEKAFVKIWKICNSVYI